MGHSAGTFSITVSGLRFEVTDLPSDPILDAFYDGYDAAFVLPAEKEPIAGFRRCLTLNHPPTYDHLHATYGAFREVVFVAVEAATSVAIGGGNFIVIAHKPASESAASYRTIHLNYVFVLPNHRRRGNFKRLVSAIDPLATRALPPSDRANSFVFIEQNDPLKMSPDAYAEDTRRTGLDQVERIALWARQGARVVDFDSCSRPCRTIIPRMTRLLYAFCGLI